MEGDTSVTSHEDYVAGNYIIEGFYRDVLGEYSTYKTTAVNSSYGHWNLPTPNLNTEVCSQRIPLDSEFKYKVSRPKPFLPPSNIHPADLKKGDPIELILQEKKEWERKLQSLIALAKKGKKWSAQQDYGLHFHKVKKKNANKPIYTVNSYVDVAKHVAKDPYPSFSGKHNWLLTGGSTTICDIDGEKYLLSTSGKNVNFLCATCIDQQGQEFKVKDTQKSTCLPLRHQRPIHQVVANSFGDKGILGVRQGKVCSVVRLRSGSTKPVTARTLLEIQEEDDIFTSIDMDPFECNKFCTLDSGPILKLWDLNTSSCVSSAEMVTTDGQSQSSSWGFIEYSNTRNEMFVLNRKSVFVKDQRMPLSQNIMEFSPSSMIDDCEELELLLKSSSLPVVYTATTHHMLSLDLRVGWAQRWTHLLKSPPMFGTVFSDAMRFEEVVLLSSCIPDDTVAIANRWKDDQVESDTFPIGLPSTRDCLLLARAHGKCLGRRLKKRLDMSTTGLTLLTSVNGEGFTSLRSTSLGDVFSQQFLAKSSMNDFPSLSIKEEIQADVKVWEKWEEAHENACCKNKPELTCPVISNNDIFEYARAPWKKDMEKAQKVKHWQATFRPIFKANYQSCDKTYSDMLMELSAYKDVLAGVLLRAWDDEGFASAPDSRHYVESWLGNVTPSCDGLRREYDGDASESGTHVPAPSLPSSLEFGTSVLPAPLASPFDETFDLSKANGNDTVFQVPTTPSARPKKKIKRESLGF